MQQPTYAGDRSEAPDGLTGAGTSLTSTYRPARRPADTADAPARRWRPGDPARARRLRVAGHPHPGGSGDRVTAARAGRGRRDRLGTRRRARARRVPDLLGARDDAQSFQPGEHPGLRAAHRRLQGLRIPRTGDLVGDLVPAVLEQRVQSVDAHAAWRRLLYRHGDPAPGPAPAGMRVPPDALGWRHVPVWDWRRAGVDDQRASTVLRAMAVASRLEEPVYSSPAEVRRRMLTVPGIGPWTVGEVTRRVLGDADAVSVGDLHLPRLVGSALEGRRVEHDEVLAVLDPWRPHRARVVRLLELTDHAAPRTRPLPRRAGRPDPPDTTLASPTHPEPHPPPV